MGAGVAMPIFTFGRTLAAIDSAEATQRGAVAEYTKVVQKLLVKLVMPLWQTAKQQL